MGEGGMRVAVVGATGQVGRRVVAALSRVGCDVLEMSRSAGVDVLDGGGLAGALAGVDAVVDTLNSPARSKEDAVAFFGTTTRNLLDAEQRSGVRHHVLLSVVGVDRVEGTAHYAGKREQERLVEGGSVPWTTLRATQFFGFAAMVAKRATRRGEAVIPAVIVQPVDVVEVADALALAALGTPQGRLPDLAGPEPMSLLELARRTLAARGDPTRVRTGSWDDLVGVATDSQALLPGPSARLGTTTFEAWLSGQRLAP